MWFGSVFVNWDRKEWVKFLGSIMFDRNINDYDFFFLLSRIVSLDFLDHLGPKYFINENWKSQLSVSLKLLNQIFWVLQITLFQSSSALPLDDLFSILRIKY